jgi:hypothetical protein
MSCANICLQIRLRATEFLADATSFACQCANFGEPTIDRSGITGSPRAGGTAISAI